MDAKSLASQFLTLSVGEQLEFLHHVANAAEDPETPSLLLQSPVIPPLKVVLYLQALTRKMSIAATAPMVLDEDKVVGYLKGIDVLRHIREKAQMHYITFSKDVEHKYIERNPENQDEYKVKPHTFNRLVSAPALADEIHKHQGEYVHLRELGGDNLRLEAYYVLCSMEYLQALCAHVFIHAIPQEFIHKGSSPSLGV